MTWEPCPGGRAVNVDRQRWEAQCPHCDYTFSTVVDDPVVPPHYRNEAGGQEGGETWTAEEIETAKARGLAMRDALFGPKRDELYEP